MNILNLESISKTYMSKPVLNNVSIGIDSVDKIGVVGANGTGKSTLLAITAGRVEADSGKVVMGNDIRISYLPQNPEFDLNKNLLENITDAIYSGGDHWDKMGEIKANLAKFLDRVVTRIFAFTEDGTLFQSEGGYSDYIIHRQKVAETVNGEGRAEDKRADAFNSKKDKEEPGNGRKSQNSYKQPREKIKLSYKEQKEYDNIENEIEALEEKSEELSEMMVKAATDYPHLMELTREKETVDAQIEAKMERFIELQEMVDKFNSK